MSQDEINIPESEFEFKYARSSGPGGQNVNKVNSKAILYWDIHNTTAIRLEVIARFKVTFRNSINKDGMVVIASDEHRDQPRNAQNCIDKLKAMISKVLHPPKKRIPTKPSKNQKARRLNDKREHSDRKSSRKKVDY